MLRLLEHVKQLARFVTQFDANDLSAHDVVSLQPPLGHGWRLPWQQRNVLGLDVHVEKAVVEDVAHLTVME